MMPPSSSRSSEYFACPMAIAESLPASAESSAAAASGPTNTISAMCERSKRPEDVRTAWCSARSLE